MSDIEIGNVEVNDNEISVNSVDIPVLKGDKGDKGNRGAKGDPGPKGDPGTTNYNDLDNKPTRLSEFENDEGFINSDVSDLQNYYDKDTTDGLLDGKVDIEEGKGLSTNDFTDTYKDNVDSNTSLRHTHTNKSVLDDIDSTDISNWNGKQSEITSNNKLSSDLVDDANNTNKFVTPTEKNTWNNKQDTLTAGTNITIENNVISASGSGAEYTAGDNIQISAQNVISATDTTYTAGSNVNISDENVISAINTTYTAGSNVQISDQNVISATDTTYSNATQSTAGLMSSNDKKSLDEITTDINLTLTDTSTIQNANVLYTDEIDLKGNTSQQTYTGKNLLNTTASTTITNFGITVTVDEKGNITLNGTATEGCNLILNKNVNFVGWGGTIGDRKINLSNTAYTLSFNYISGTRTQKNNAIYITNAWSNPSIYVEKVISDATVTEIFTPSSSSDVFVYLYIQNAQVFTNYKFNVQVEQGSTSTSYEPYTGGQPSPSPDYPQDIHVVTGDCSIKEEAKNVLKVEDTVEKVSNGVKTTILNGKFSISGTASANWYNISNNVTQEIKAGTYTFSSNTASNYIRTISATYVDNTTERFSIPINSLSKTITISKNIKSYYIYMSKDNSSGTTLDIPELYFQLEKGSIATQWEQYKETNYPITLGNIELCKIGDYQDKIYKDNGKWYLYKAIQKVVLDGNSFKITKYSSKTNTSWFRIVNFDFNPKWEVNTPGITMNTHFQPCSIYVIQSVDTEKLALDTQNQDNTNAITIRINSNRLNTDDVEGFKNWLSNNNVIVYVVLATPTTTEITDGTLIYQLEAISKMKTYKNSTTLTTTGADLAPIVDLTLTNALKKENLYTAGTNVNIDKNNVISATDTIYTAGTNINISDQNVISATDTTYEPATTSTDGLMSKEDKIKLDGIVERGHNSYGDWIKFVDGTMICTATISLGNITYGTAYGAVYRAGTYYSWTFPQEFANTNDLVVFGNIYAGTAIGGTNLRSPLTTTKAEYFLYIMSQNTVDTIVYITAIGRWK